MQQAGWSWIRIRIGGFSMGWQTMSWSQATDDPDTAYGYTEETPRMSVPTTRDIWLMDQANEWLQMIPDDLGRRVVALRVLYNDDRGRCVHSIRKIGKRLHISDRAVRKLYERGLERICSGLRVKSSLLSKIVLYLPDLEGPNSVRMDFGVSGETSPNSAPFSARSYT